MLRPRGENIHNSASGRKLSGPLHLHAAFIARLDQMLRQRAGRRRISADKLDTAFPQKGGRERELRRRLGRGQHDLRSVERKQGRKTLLHIFARNPLRFVKRQVHRGIEHCFHRESRKLPLQTATARFIRAQENDFPFYGNQPAQKGLSLLGKTGHCNRLLPFPQQSFQLHHMGERAEFILQSLHFTCQFHSVYSARHRLHRSR